MPVRLPAICVKQKGATLYLTSITPRVLRQIADVDVCDPARGRPDGYQRPREDSRCRQLARYIEQEDSILPNSLLLNIRPDGPRSSFHSLPTDRGFGYLELPLERGAAWIVDGQHRNGAFEFTSEEYQDLPLPAVFIDGFDRVREATTFFVVNSKQKNVSPSLKYFDLMRFADKELRRWLEGPEGDWKVRAGQLVERLNNDEDSPWYQRINLTGARGTKRPVNLVSFITALQTVVQDRWFNTLPDARQVELLKQFWNAVRVVWPQPWRSNKPREYVLLKSLGVYAMSHVAIELFHICRRISDFSEQRMVELLEPLQGAAYGWRSDSPIAAYGGMKGYKLLAMHLVDLLREASRAVVEAAGALDPEAQARDDI